MNATASKGDSGRQQAAQSTQTNAINLLKADHKKVMGVMNRGASPATMTIAGDDVAVADAAITPSPADASATIRVAS